MRKVFKIGSQPIKSEIKKKKVKFLKQKSNKTRAETNPKPE